MSTVGSAETLPGLLLERATRTPSAPALRFHQYGIWEQESWASLLDKVREVGNGLAALGVGNGDVIGIVSANHPTWVIADLGAQGLGATTVAVDPEFSPGAVVTLLQTHRASLAIVGNQEQLDKLVESRQLLPLLQRIVVVDTRGVRDLDRRDNEQPADGVMTWEQLVALGKRSPSVWDASVSTLDPDRAITVEVHVERRDGTAPGVKAISTSSRQLLEDADDLRQRLGAHAGDELHPVASFADPVERAVSEALALRVGAVMNIGEGGQLLTPEARDVQPTIAHVPADRLRAMRLDVERRRAKRGVRKFAVERILQGSGSSGPATGGSGRSRSAGTDIAVLKVAAAVLLGVCLAVHRILADQSGLLRLAIIAVLLAATAAWLLIGGFAVRPFIRKSYGLARAHSLLTSPDVDTETARFLSALRLAPILERRSGAGPSQSAEDVR